MRLPQELRDIIIDFGSDDKPFLAQCALVCREWLPSSRFHLFRRITIQGYPRLFSWIELVNSPNATILPSQPSLDICMIMYWTEPSDGPVSLPTAGPAVQSLTVINTSLVRFLDSLFQLPLFSSITSLTLNGTISRTCDQLFKFIASYPFLTHLHLMTTCISQIECNGESAITFPPPPPFLRDIAVDSQSPYIPLKVILKWLNSAPSPLPVTHLRLEAVKAEDAPLVRRFMDTIRTSLVSLELYLCNSLDEIDYEDVSSSHELSQLCDLSFLASLRTLRTTANCWQFWNSPALLRCFASVPRLETLVIELGYDLFKRMSEETAEAEPFERLEDVLCTSYLKRVEFWGRYDCERFVRMGMKRCSEMGVLFFTRVG